MPRVALVTYAGLPELSADDRLLLAPLAARGVRAEPATWEDQAVAWDSYDALVIRSTWNYHLVLDVFLTWIDRVQLLGVPIWNPPPILRWNSTKAYLRELEARGVEIVPTRWVAGAAGPSLAALLDETAWPDAVVKPAVSASAYETWRVTAGRVTAEDEARVRRLARRAEGVMVQRFVPELANGGEWSLVFLDGEYSHAALKRPRAGDFRVQPEHGGTVEAHAAPEHLVASARAIMNHAPGRPLYGRVDGCEIDGRFVLVELELLEPSLFLGAHGRAPERFAEAICRVANARG